MTSFDEIRELSLQISKAVDSLEKHVSAHKTANPVRGHDLEDIPPTVEYEKVRMTLANATETLQTLIIGPEEHIHQLTFMLNDVAALQAAAELDMFRAVPPTGSIALSEISRKINLDSERTGSILRLLATKHVFVEVEPDVFAHSPTSRFVAMDDDVQAFLEFHLDELLKSSVELAANLKKNPVPCANAPSPFETRHGMPLFGFLAKNPSNAARFAKAMAGVVKMDRPVLELEDQYPWAKFAGSTIVDVGGGNGHISRTLAQLSPDLKFIVQDSSEEMLEQGRRITDPALQDRFTFMNHSFFEPQPVDDAGAFLIRRCTHNWNDENCARILRAFVPALEKCKPGTPLFISDPVIPALNEASKYEEHALRQMDILMLLTLGAKERSVKQFESLLAQVDRRLKVVGVHSTGLLGLLEIQLVQSQ